MEKFIKRYGPYNSNGYVLFIDMYESGKRRSVLQHVAVMETFLGRKVPKGEIVHHKDGDKSNNDISNLEVITSISKHVKLHALEHPAALVQLKCIECGKEFSRTSRQEKRDALRRKNGPYCSKNCVGKLIAGKSRSKKDIVVKTKSEINECKKKGLKIEVECIRCGKKFERLLRQESYRKSINCKGPYCGSTCINLDRK